MARADKALSARRVDDILRIRLDGAKWWHVCEFVREKEQEAGSAWFLEEGESPLSDSQIRRYQTRADRLMVEENERSRRTLRRRHVAMRENLYAKAATTGDVRTALTVLQDIDEFLGLYPPKKVAPTTPDGKEQYSGGGMSDADRATALGNLYARMGAGAGGTAADGEARADGSLLGESSEADG
jgi:hypothetical protein